MGPLGSLSSPYSNFVFDVNPPKTKINLRLKNVPLLLGTYFLTLGLNGPEQGEAYDLKPQAAHFKIIAPPTNSFGFGLNDFLKFEHSWESFDN
jgi:hypothetical protein